MRTDGRDFNELRKFKIEPEVVRYAEGSARIQVGDTIVICTASVEESIPKWLQGSGSGWISAEYGMLPRSTHTRIQREKAFHSGRSQEISRLIGRSLRSTLDLKGLGERQIMIDCDVMQADGGTRTAAITGGFIALVQALSFLKNQGVIKTIPIKHYVSAVSVGIKKGQPLLDLNYDEDSTIDTDMNFVMTDLGHFIEIQGTAENGSFSQGELNEMMVLAAQGCQQFISTQKQILGHLFDRC